ncbi:MAG TPA: hypothetical protein GX695_06620, partial [Acholeplasmataceae bacterium]|nr:hypothetical protein [Acholeplasmataceae bacterium]
MNKFIINKIFNDKNKYIIYALIIITIVIFILLIPFKDSIQEILLFTDYYKNTYNSMVLEFLRILLPITTLIISFEHDEPFLRSLSPYFSRDYLFKLKQFNYLMIITLYFIIIASVYIIIL